MNSANFLNSFIANQSTALKFKDEINHSSDASATQRAPTKRTVNIKCKNFTIKTAETVEEFTQAFRLRYEVFHQEMIGTSQLFGIDSDPLDLAGDILIVKDDLTQKTIGTYRLISSIKSDAFYSESEFNLGEFLSIDGTKLELSRACIDKTYRNGLVISLLWRGIVAYLKAIDAKYLFGCSSIWTTCPKTINEIVKSLDKKNSLLQNFDITPKDEYRWKRKSTAVTGNVSPESLIPPLLKFYLRAGAKVAPVPAFDAEFNCFDLLTILDLQAVNEKYERKFL